MRRVVMTAAVLVGLAAPASAQNFNIPAGVAGSPQKADFTVPAGDALALTPPVDITPEQSRAAPPQFRTSEKIQQLKREPGVDPNLFQGLF